MDKPFCFVKKNKDLLAIFKKNLHNQGRLYADCFSTLLDSAYAVHRMTSNRREDSSSEQRKPHSGSRTKKEEALKDALKKNLQRRKGKKAHDKKSERTAH